MNESHPPAHIKPGDLVKCPLLEVGPERVYLVVNIGDLVSGRRCIDNGTIEVEFADGRRSWLPTNWVKLHQEG